MKVYIARYDRYGFVELVDPAELRAVVGCYGAVSNAKLCGYWYRTGRKADVQAQQGVAVNWLPHGVQIVVRDTKGDES